MVTHGVDAVFIPRVIRSRAKAEPIQCGCDLFVRELAGHFANHINGVETRTMAMFSSLTLLHAKFRMTATGPVNEQDSFAAIFIDVRNDLLNEDPNDPVLQSHVRSWRVPHGRQILGQAYKDFRIWHPP